MKKITILILALVTILVAQNADTSITKLTISDVKYYDVIDDSVPPDEKVISSEKPFAFKQPNDKWFSKDKWMHFTTSYFLTLQSTYALEKMFFTPPEESRYFSIGISLSFSLGKEFYDVFQKKGIFSWKDLFYDILGTGLGYLTATSLQK